jgi:hypothetical protein
MFLPYQYGDKQTKTKLKNEATKMNTTQIKMIREGVFSTAHRNMVADHTRATCRAAIIEALNLYGLTGKDATNVGDWCMAQMGYGG